MTTIETDQKQVSEGPILMQGDMVSAILARRKRQTRRLINRMRGFRKIRQFGPSSTPGYDWCFRDHRGLWQEMRTHEVYDRCLYGKPGDRLWVRENYFCATGQPGPTLCHYQADKPKGTFKGFWKPSIHMPRWASRILLQITSIGIEQVQSITEHDALAEGCYYLKGHATLCVGNELDLKVGRIWPHAKQWYQSLWKELHGEASWNANPWVWVIRFEVLSTEGGKA